MVRGVLVTLAIVAAVFTSTAVADDSSMEKLMEEVRSARSALEKLTKEHISVKSEAGRLKSELASKASDGACKAEAELSQALGDAKKLITTAEQSWLPLWAHKTYDAAETVVHSAIASVKKMASEGQTGDTLEKAKTWARTTYAQAMKASKPHLDVVTLHAKTGLAKARAASSVVLDHPTVQQGFKHSEKWYLELVAWTLRKLRSTEATAAFATAENAKMAVMTVLVAPIAALLMPLMCRR